MVATGREAGQALRRQRAAGFIAAWILVTGCGALRSRPVVEPTPLPSATGSPVTVSYDTHSQVPWLDVRDSRKGSVELRLWDGGPVYLADCPIERKLPPPSTPQYPPLPPWHITIRDHATGVLLAETLVSPSSPGRLVFIEPRSVSFAVADGTELGPMVTCAGA